MKVNIVVTLPASSRASQLLEGMGDCVLRHRWLVRIEDLGRGVWMGGVMRVLVAIYGVTKLLFREAYSLALRILEDRLHTQYRWGISITKGWL